MPLGDNALLKTGKRHKRIRGVPNFEGIGVRSGDFLDDFANSRGSDHIVLGIGTVTLTI